eukprot:CAMPEP_0116051210 /NCGR_PEP_ID=MMETSP0322-20121206/848_1 /TAXON_ID=163516 /ORGANISM="Leptocylindrus danicus var. apora, Strain B651" /LENGTH=222 /DNA_ID=CAMNT_0003533923 /DNA_START=68 /DNA_END=736 /DNA_ORIENTATION=+
MYSRSLHASNHVRKNAADQLTVSSSPYTSQNLSAAAKYRAKRFADNVQEISVQAKQTGFIPAQSGVGNPSSLPIKHMMTKTGGSIVANSSVNGIRNRNDTSSSSVRETSYEKVVIASNKRQTSNVSEKPFYSSTVVNGSNFLKRRKPLHTQPNESVTEMSAAGPRQMRAREQQKLMKVSQSRAAAEKVSKTERPVTAPVETDSDMTVPAIIAGCVIVGSAGG